MILLTGGSGLLGSELQKSLCFYAPTREVLDFVKDDLSVNGAFRNQLFEGVDLIVHAGAFTDVCGAETQKELCYQTNVIGTRNLASLGIPMLYISTEYVFDGEKGNYEENDYPNPQNFYSLTKTLGEAEASKGNSVVVRCLFKPNPFEHPIACTDQWTSGDTIEIIGKEIVHAIRIFNKLPPIIHIGTGRKSTFELAQKTRDVKPCLRSDLSVRLPRDTSLNTRLWEKIKHDHRIC